MMRIQTTILLSSLVAVVLCAEDNLPPPAARIAGGGDPSRIGIIGIRKLGSAGHVGFVGEVSPYLKKLMEKEEEAKKNQPRPVMSVFTRTASIQSPWFVPRSRTKTTNNRLAELSERAIPLHRRASLHKTAHFL